MYQPTVGRFMSIDPLSADGVDVIPNTGWFGKRLDAMRERFGSGDANLYRYCLNNPVLLVDPSGLQETCPPTIKPKEDKKETPIIPFKECESICEEARKAKLNRKKATDKEGYLGLVVCGKTKDGKLIPCPCPFDISRGGTDVKWDECPEIARCIVNHELGHIVGDVTKTGCDSTNAKVHPAKGDRRTIDDYHKKQLAADINPSYSPSVGRK